MFWYEWSGLEVGEGEGARELRGDTGSEEEVLGERREDLLTGIER